MRRDERGDAGLGLLLTLVGLLIVPAAMLSDRVQDTTSEMVLYITAIGLAIGIFRAIRKYIIKPVALMLERTADIPGIKDDVAHIKTELGLDAADEVA